MVKVLIVDDHPIVRTGIALLLKAADNINVVGEAASGEEAINLARELKPDVILMDINMPGIGGMEATIRLLRNNRKLKIVIISTQTEGILPFRLIHLGISGYLTKFASREEFLHAIQTVAEGKLYFDPAVMKEVTLQRLDSPYNKYIKILEQLSERELQVLLMICRGVETNEIAEKLFLSIKTINGYRCSLQKKLGAKNDVEITKIAITNGLMDWAINNPTANHSLN